MQELADWLEKLGMSEYVQRFAENDIDFAVLHDLTDQDLKELGVSLGHRRKLLRAIAELNGGSKDTARPSTEAAAAVATQEIAERRQVTVMFSDLVGSTALSVRMDPEDLREVIAAYQKCVAETVRKFGGFVAKYMGDGVLVYFGYPQAHEDDAERAVRAGLELVAAVSNLKTHASLQIRVGIATGLVVVGDLIGSGASQEQAVVGETPNLAARLQGIAEPNTVVIAESTRKLLGNLFELEDLGAQDLKGIAGPVRAWAALRPSSVESRFEALHASGLTDLVGRDEELELLLRRWAKAKSGQGQVVLLSGEPGIGKSRLTAALLERLATEPHTRVRYFCSPQHTDSAFFPIISQMERAAGFAHDDTAQVKLDKLDALLAQSFTPRQDAALFAEMLSLPNDGRYPTLEMAPQQRRQKTLEALTAQLETLSRQKPVLMILEDAHWADPTSLEAFSRAVDRVRTLGVLLIVTYRPEFEPPWIGRPHVTALLLNRLGESEIAAIIDSLAGNKLLSLSVRQDIIERTDGIPLFVEEMTKAVLEAEGEGAGRQTAAAVPSPALTVPASLHASLMARLDRLGPAKEVAQIGAAVGREFSQALLEAVAGKPEAQLGSALDRIVAAGLLFRQGSPPDATYLFKHALVQDAAYSTLLREQRRALHARIANVLEEQFPDIAEHQPELLARHCTEAGSIEKAADLWGKAGQRSLARSALVEGVEQLARSLDQIATMPVTTARRHEQIKLQVALLSPLGTTKGFAAPETRAAVERARVLIEQAEAIGEGSQQFFSVLFGLWVANLINFNGAVQSELAAQYLTLAEKEGSAIHLMIGHRIAAMSLTNAGHLTEARSHFDKGIALYNPAKHRPLATRFQTDARVTLLSYRAWALWMLGHPETALADTQRALEEAREINQTGTSLFALFHAPMPLVSCGCFAKANSIVEELSAFADAKGAASYKAGYSFFRTWILAMTGNVSDALDVGVPAIASNAAQGTTLFFPLFSALLAKSYADVGRAEDAWDSIGAAINMMEVTQEKWSEAEVTRIAGEIALKGPEPDATKAQAYFERALTVARQQQAKSWELRAAMSTARLWRSQGKPQQARELLAPIYGWFTEGFDTRDLKEAKALLGELGAE